MNTQDRFKEASVLHRAGRFVDAERLYRALLEREPDNADVLHLLGLLADQTGRRQEAAELVSQAVRREPRADFLNSLGLICEGLGDQAGAKENYRRAVQLDPRHGKALNNLGGLMHSRGDLAQAEACYRQAIAVAPQSAASFNNLGTVMIGQGKPIDGIAAFRQALILRPDYPEALTNLAFALIAEGALDEAIASCQRAITIRPAYGKAQLMLGIAQIAQNRAADAVHTLSNALTAMPRSAELHFQLGRAYTASSQLDRAESAFREALRLQPDYVPAMEALAGVLVEKIELQPAAAQYSKAIALRSDDALRIKRATMVPAIAQSTEEIDFCRTTMENALDELLIQDLRVSHPLTAATSGGFFLAYHGRDDRRLLEKLAAVYLRANPELDFSAPHCSAPRKSGRLRIGFISRFLHRHSIGRTTRGLIATVSREEFEVFALFAPPLVDDEISRFIREAADHWRVLSPELEKARAEISALELDVLFYQDIGMDPYTYFLAFSRLAPVQCVSFGHPNTTGIPNMDFFVSSTCFELEGSKQHYSEQLFALEEAGTLAYYYRPQLAQPVKTKTDFGLPSSRRLYLCPQSLFKFHPETDALFAAILDGDAQGEIYLIEGRVSYRAAHLADRFQRAYPKLAHRLKFLPSVSELDFLNLVAVADVMLDTVHFNGMNTSLEAFSMGVPVVTWPREFQRGRHTAGMYRRMGLENLVAQDAAGYADMALRLGLESDFNAAAREMIRNRAHLLFEDLRVTREFERFFFAACASRAV